MNKTNELIEILNKYEYKDLTIALLSIEHNNRNKLDKDTYNKYKDMYFEYMNDDNYLGLLNNLLQKI